MSDSLENRHHRRAGAVIVVGVISIGAVAVTIATNIATIMIASAVVDVAMIPRPPKSPTCIEMPAGK
eukprot:4642664-Pyramimonas_sp.AAC.1